MIDGTENADQTAIEYLVRNPVGKPVSILTNDELVQLTAQLLEEHSTDYDIVWGNWNSETGQLEESNSSL